MDIDIGKKFEREAAIQAEKEAAMAVSEDVKVESAEIVSDAVKSAGIDGEGLDGKTIGITAAILVGIFLVATFGIDMISGFAPTGAIVASVDELHVLNTDGELGSDQGYYYNEFSFVFYDGLWWTELFKTNAAGELVEIVKIPLHYGPNDIMEVETLGTLDASFDSEREIYIAIDPSVVNKYYTLSLSELNFNIVEGVGRLPIAVCTAEDEACVGRDIMSCSNNPEGKAMVELILEEGSNGRVEFDGSCVKIIGNEERLVHAADRMILHWYGIMPIEGAYVASEFVDVVEG